MRQRAEFWWSDGGTWSRTDLDTSVAGSAATDVVCSDAECLVVGRRDGVLAAWRVSGWGASDSGASGILVEPVALPDRPVDHYTGHPRVARDGPLVVIAVGAGSELLTGADGRTWTSVPSPAGDVRGLAVHDGTILLLLRDGSGA